MKILAIETSCDETAISLLDINGPLNRPDIKVLGNALMSQAKLHEKYGGVYPNLAKREHQKNLPILLEQVLLKAQNLPALPTGRQAARQGPNLEASDIDYVAVTKGPGLEPALWTGIVFAQELGKKWNRPVIPVDHMEGHIFSVLYNLSNTECLTLPALALLVSGGHTELVNVKGFGNYEIIGKTRDDAVGEAFDKVARMLGLTYPGGPKISLMAQKSRQNRAKIDIELPRPMIHSKDLDFSFSGLKTAVLYRVKAQNNELSEEFKEDMARAFEDSAIETLVTKTEKAIEKLGSTNIKTLIIGGGVSANTYLSQELKKMLEKYPEINFYIPTKDMSTDNAIMIGISAFIKLETNPDSINNQIEIKAQGNLSLTSS